MQSAAEYEEVHEQMCPAIPEWLEHKMAENQLLQMAKLLRKIEAPYFYVIKPMTPGSKPIRGPGCLDALRSTARVTAG